MTARKLYGAQCEISVVSVISAVLQRPFYRRNPLSRTGSRTCSTRSIFASADMTMKWNFGRLPPWNVCGGYRFLVYHIVMPAPAFT